MPGPEIRTGASEKLKRGERNNLRIREGTIPVHGLAWSWQRALSKNPGVSLRSPRLPVSAAGKGPLVLESFLPEMPNKGEMTASN